MIGMILVAILAILLIGVVLKIIKIALFIAVCVGIVLFARNKLSTRRIR